MFVEVDDYNAHCTDINYQKLLDVEVVKEHRRVRERVLRILVTDLQ